MSLPVAKKVPSDVLAVLDKTKRQSRACWALVRVIPAHEAVADMRLSGKRDNLPAGLDKPETLIKYRKEPVYNHLPLEILLDVGQSEPKSPNVGISVQNLVCDLFVLLMFETCAHQRACSIGFRNA